jgi:hypothetical protein
VYLLYIPSCRSEVPTDGERKGSVRGKFQELHGKEFGVQKLSSYYINNSICENVVNITISSFGKGKGKKKSLALYSKENNLTFP